jgi:copper resistance protein D
MELPKSDTMNLAMAPLLVIARWVHLCASILLAALFLFEIVIVAPYVRKPAEINQPLFLSLHQLTRRIAWWIWSIVQISWIAWLWLVTASMSGEDLIACINPDALGTVLFATQFGHLWLTRLIIGSVFGISLWLLARTSARRSILAVSLASLSGMQLVSLAWAGHAAARPGPYQVVHLLGDALHLLTSAFWPGALVPMATFSVVLLKSNQASALWLAGRVVRRFSTSSLIAVTVMAFTGLLNSVFLVGNAQVLLTTTYGQLLTLKLILFLLMVGFGAWNLLVLKPKLTVDLRAVHVAQQEIVIRSLLRNVLCEIGLGTGVILIVGLLGITPPPMR